MEKEGSPLHVGGRALDILIFLAERPGEVIDKRELVKHVWADVNVDEGSLRFHVAALRKALGSQAQASPKFDFQGTTRSRAKFLETSYALENTGVSAYLGQAGSIQTPAILLTAASIVTVEARHSGAVGELLGRNISPSGAFDQGKTMAQVLAIVKQTGFVKG